MARAETVCGTKDNVSVTVYHRGFFLTGEVRGFLWTTADGSKIATTTIDTAPRDDPRVLYEKLDEHWYAFVSRD